MFLFSSGWSVDKDGPGQRYVVYLKGCNMSCLWCANPESISKKPEILFYPERSNLSVDSICPFQAVKGREINRNRCYSCNTYECVTKWKNRCFELSGFEISPKNLAEKIIADKIMFGKNGGITFGGGEPTLQADEILATLDFLQGEQIHTAIETNASTTGFRKLINRITLLICDFKCFSSDRHKEWTEKENEAVLNNLRFAGKNQKELLIRIPLVRGFNTNDKEINLICGFLGEIRQLRSSLNVEVLRMHHMGKPKYAALGIDYPVENILEPDIEQAEKLKNKLIKYGITLQ